MPSQKRPAGDANGAPAKQVKAEHPEEFSNAVKKKLQSSQRTGQACDRCKVRKIRCDALPGGCSPCLQNNSECRTTDRITGRATSRGYVEGLEQQNRDLQHRIRELEQRLTQSGADIKPANGYHDAQGQVYDYQPAVPTPSWNSATSSYASQNNSSMTVQQQETNMFRALPAFRAGCTGDNYLGVSPGNSHLSSIKGTALSILGMEIDIADFESTDMDEPDSSVFHPQLYNKSYQAFLQSALNINPRMEKVNLPDRNEGLTYAAWYFRVLNPFVPLLHKPTFMKLLTRFYDDPNFLPTTAETVMVHMVFAIMFFQYAARNWEDPVQQANLTHSSNMHYHYSLSKFYQLSCSHTFADVQALTLICAHLRNFPKPGASWILTQTTISLAIELGLHRSAKQWAPDSIPNPLDIEMRKRTFWALLAIHVTLSGKLGRPMAFRLEDYDVEMPEEVDDELLSENGLDTSRPGKCLHNIGLHAIRILPLFMELYATIYAVQRPKPEAYISTINSLESKLRTWKENLPADLVKGEGGQNEQEGRVFALYAQIWALEFRLLLRHPSVSMTTDATFNAENMRICVESSRQMLGVVMQLQKYKSLDTTWYNSAVYVMAITTTLFAQWDKRGETSTADLAALRDEMDKWLDIMGDVGALLVGSGNKLREAVRVVTDGTLGLLSRSLPVKNTANYVQNNSLPDSKSPSHRSNSASAYPSSSSNPHVYAFETAATSHGNTATNSSYIQAENQLSHPQTPYPAATQYSTYPESASTTSLAYTPHETSHAYSNYPNTSDSVEAPLLAAFAQQASQVQANSTWQRSPNTANSGSQASWQQWTNTLAGNLEPQDCFSASALVQLGGRVLAQTNGNSGQRSSMGDMNTNQVGVNMEHGISGMSAQANGGMATANQWPLNIFDIGHGSSS
ncbi:hypothetical protein BDZ45DRAFT_580482 [Acephala macrosclerotiorum]|nr:hypothetical protein BDZ45DRAFT_580482 [Acephala macrosclerotiorum]